jgi:gluconate 5-dehydrogenase
MKGVKAMNLFSLEGKNAMVCGGAGGLGKAIAVALGQTGASISISSRNIDKLGEAAKEIEAECGNPVNVFQVDVDSEESVCDMVKASINALKHVDILVNATGFATKALALEIDIGLWDSMFKTNVRGTMLCCREYAKHMAQIGGGRIINLSSVRGFIANAGGNSAYCATKGAVNMITRTLAAEFAQYNINVNAIAPSLVVTNCTSGYVKERMAATIEKIPLHRLGEPNDIAGSAVFLAGPAANFITGQILCIDGGLTAVG